eukprot:2607992-Amphidinium_carterae.1
MKESTLCQPEVEPHRIERIIFPRRNNLQRGHAEEVFQESTQKNAGGIWKPMKMHFMQVVTKAASVVART